MTQQLDDLEAVRTLITTLKNLKKMPKKGLLDGRREKLGLEISQQTQPHLHSTAPTTSHQISPVQHHPSKDLKSFVNEKNPSSDMQFAATVAYYYRFEAPPSERKESIDSNILQNAARLANRKRLSKPGQTLINAGFNGMLDRADEKGFYKINTVGENLVAMILPQGSSSQRVKPKSKNKNLQQKKNFKASKK